MQREGAPIEEIRPGDVVWFPPGEKHWHGAGPKTAMSARDAESRLNLTLLLEQGQPRAR